MAKSLQFLGDYLAFLLCEHNIVEFILHQKNHENTRVVQVLPVSAAVLTLRLHTGRFVVFFVCREDRYEFIFQPAWTEATDSRLSQPLLWSKK